MYPAFNNFGPFPLVLRSGSEGPPARKVDQAVGSDPGGPDSSAIDDALAALPADLKARLGALVDAPQAAAELAIALFPYGYRALLSSYRLVETAVPSDVNEAELDHPRRKIRLLDLGKRIIEACAAPPEPVGPVADLESEASDLRERYGEDLPFETEEAEE